MKQKSVFYYLGYTFLAFIALQMIIFVSIDLRLTHSHILLNIAMVVVAVFLFTLSWFKIGKK